MYTDQKSLKHILQQRVASCDQHCWVSKLLGYHFDVIYKPGPENKVADSLSQISEEGALAALVSFPVWELGEDLKQEVISDPSLKGIMAVCSLTRIPDMGSA